MLLLSSVPPMYCHSEDTSESVFSTNVFLLYYFVCIHVWTLRKILNQVQYDNWESSDMTRHLSLRFALGNTINERLYNKILLALLPFRFHFFLRICTWHLKGYFWNLVTVLWFHHSCLFLSLFGFIQTSLRICLVSF